MKTAISFLLLGATALFALAISMSTSTSSVADAAKISTEGTHGRIVKENRYILFNSRQLSGECMQICTAPDDEPAPPVVEVLSCPVATEEPQHPCVHDTDCLVSLEGLPLIYGACPKCVKKSGSEKGYCFQPDDIKGNLNCCKRTPGNDLVITNGCGANNVCVGFNDHDQCNVNQKALHCNPCCKLGNIEWNTDGTVKVENGKVVTNSKCQDGTHGTCGNDQGNQHVFPAIYPYDFCTTDKIKWTERKGNKEADLDYEGTMAVLDTMVKQAADSGSTLEEVFAPTSVVTSDLSAECAEPPETPEPDCVTADDCWNKYPWFNCPVCVEGGICKDVADTEDTSAVQEIVPAKPNMPKGNVNCCKRTPGTENIITNGCGANNICIGFRLEDQCEVNDKAAYCHIGCPKGNVKCKTSDGVARLCSLDDSDKSWTFQTVTGTDSDGNPINRKVFATDKKGAVAFDPSYELNDECFLNNYNGKDDNGNINKPMVRVFPMDWCMCRNVYWKQQQHDPDTVTDMCDYTSDDPNLQAVYDQGFVNTQDVVPGPGCVCADNNNDEDGCAACGGCTWVVKGKKCVDSTS